MLSFLIIIGHALYGVTNTYGKTLGIFLELYH